MTSEGRGLTIGSRGITKNSVSCIERFVGPSAHRAPRPRSAPQPPRSGFVRSQGPPLQPPVSGSDRLTSASRSAASTSDAAPAAMHRNSRAPAGAQSTRVNVASSRSSTALGESAQTRSSASAFASAHSGSFGPPPLPPAPALPASPEPPAPPASSEPEAPPSLGVGAAPPRRSMTLGYRARSRWRCWWRALSQIDSSSAGASLA